MKLLLLFILISINLFGFSQTSGTFTDARDNKTYKTVVIGTQTWMAENLNFKPLNKSWCYNDSSRYCIKYGRLYDWKTAKISCPSGWHLPSDAEWKAVIEYLGGISVAGGKMKETGTVHWNKPNKGADNNSGFTALPGGGRDNNGSYNYTGSSYGNWWSSTEKAPPIAWSVYLEWFGPEVSGGTGTAVSDKGNGFSVRCIKD